MNILLVLFLLGVITACGAKDAEQDESKAAADSVSEERVVQHLFGETVVKETPKKVTSLMPGITDYLLSLGITPYASVSAGPEDGEYPWYLKDRLQDTQNIGWALNSDIEVLLSIEPDLILANEAFEKVYEDYTKIAPTVIVDAKEDEEGVKDMRQTFLFVAEIFGETEKAQEIIAEYDELIEQSRKTVLESIGEETVMFLRVTSSELRYYSAKNYEVLYKDLGVQTPAHFPGNETTFEPLSFEMLPEIDPDHIFLLVDSEEKLDEVQRTPLWEHLTAVQKEQVYPVDYSLWFQGFGPIANQLIVEDAVDKLTKN